MHCRGIVTQSKREEQAQKLMKELIVPGNVKSVLSLTIAVKQSDVTPEEAGNVKKVLQEMSDDDIIVDGVCSLERGDKENHLHCQCMLHGPFRLRKFEHQTKLKEIFDLKQCFERSYTCFVEHHKLDENRSWMSLSGCAFESCTDCVFNGHVC